MFALDDDFQPGSSIGTRRAKLTDFLVGPHDVICGRGKKCYTHAGNVRFRNKVTMRLAEYTSFRTKDEKSHVVTMVVNEIRRESGFVKQNSSGVWHEVGDFLAREKTSQAFRDCLSDRYKSSSISRRKKRQSERAKKEPTKTKSSVPADEPCDRLNTHFPHEDGTKIPVGGPSLMTAAKSSDTTNAPNNPPIPIDTDMRPIILPPTPRVRRRSSISVCAEFFSGDIIDFGMDSFWDEAGHRDHHSLPDEPISWDLGDDVPQHTGATSVPEVPLASARRGSSDSIGHILAFINKEEKDSSMKCGDDEDMSSVSEWDLEPLEFSSVFPTSGNQEE